MIGSRITNNRLLCYLGQTLLLLVITCLITSCSVYRTRVSPDKWRYMELRYVTYKTSLVEEWPRAAFQDSCGTYYFVIQEPVSFKSVKRYEFETLTVGDMYRLRLYRYDQIADDARFFTLQTNRMSYSINGNPTIVDLNVNVYYCPDLMLTRRNVYLKMGENLPSQGGIIWRAE